MQANGAGDTPQVDGSDLPEDHVNAARRVDDRLARTPRTSSRGLLYLPRYPPRMIDVCIAGITGWVGVPLADAVHAADDLRLVGGVARGGAGSTIAGAPVHATLEEALATPFDVLVDYTAADVARTLGVPDVPFLTWRHLLTLSVATLVAGALAGWVGSREIAR